MAATRDYLEKFCLGKSFKLSEYADKIIAAINRRGGFCPCRAEEVECPCPTHEQEVEKDGHCHCNLFVKV